MSKKEMPRGRAVALVAAVLLTAAGCGARPTAAPSSEEPVVAPVAAVPPVAAPVAAPVVPPRVPGFSYGDPSQVCHRFVAALYSGDATRDAGPRDAFVRASAYASGSLAGQSAAARDGRWETWVRHRAHVDVQVFEHVEMHPEPDSSIAAYRAVRVTATPVGADGWRGWTERSIVHCTLRPGDGGQPGWRVAHYDLEPVRP
ncbi:hypothetical protein AB0B10_25635 [Micromonospora arborensis]|uniref:hypothetical protein n=1 Tax=Micromonospora arborensis TaxID=2116518 RepID=UPI0033F69614